MLVAQPQVVPSLVGACLLAAIKSMSRYVRIACSGLIVTSLLQAWSKLILKTFHPQPCCNFSHQLVASLQISSCILMFTDIIQLDEANRFDVSGDKHVSRPYCGTVYSPR